MFEFEYLLSGDLLLLVVLNVASVIFSIYIFINEFEIPHETIAASAGQHGNSTGAFSCPAHIFLRIFYISASNKTSHSSTYF